MYSYIARRLAFGALTVVGVSIMVFVIMRINGVFEPPIGLFLIALALVAEVTLTAGGANRS